MKVSAWNTYHIDGSGKLVCAMDYQEQSITKALDIAEAQAKSWNDRTTDDDWQVNMLSCNGHVRAII